MFRNCWSDVVSVPGRLLVLKPLGVDVQYSSSRLYLVSIGITMLLVYFSGVVCERVASGMRP